MVFLNLSLYAGGTSRKPRTPVVVQANRIQVMEPHGEGTRIQFNLNEPSLYVKESMDDILSMIYKASENRHLLRVINKENS